MRATGIILVIIGILMLMFNGFNMKREKKVVDIGNVEINQKETSRVSWPMWAGGVAVIAGIVLVVADRKKGEN